MENAGAPTFSPDGARLFTTGWATASEGSSDRDYVTAAFDTSSGLRLWVKRYNGPARGDDLAFGLAISPDGMSVFVTGVSEGSTSDDFATIAYDARTGSQVWAKRYNAPARGDDLAVSLAVAPDGTAVHVTGSTANCACPWPANDYATVSYDASTGSQRWVRIYHGPVDFDDYPDDVAVSRGGRIVYVTGASHGHKGGYNYATVAYRASTGLRLWVARYIGPGNSFPGDVAVGQAAVFVTGASDPAVDDYDSDYATVAYDMSTGAELWARRYDGPASGVDVAGAIGVSSDDGTVFVGGSSEGVDTGFDIATLAYEAT
jgi:hypothetical protein